jgi:hypothetical protein
MSEALARVDHARGLCGKPDLTGYGLSEQQIADLALPREAAEANPPPCRCCAHPMRVVGMSLSFEVLGMYRLECDVCTPQSR